MKNLKIRAKIILGFVVVIFFILLNGITVFVTNSITINEIKTMTVENKLTTKSNEVLDSYSATRVPANLLYASINNSSQAQYEENVAATSKLFDEALAIADANPELSSFKPTLQASNDQFDLWRGYVDDVVLQNEIRQKDILTIFDLGEETSTALTALVLEQISLLTQDAAGDDAAELVRRGKRIESIFSGLASFTEARAEAETMLSSLDMAKKDEVFEQLDSFIAIMEDFRDSSARQYNKDAAQAVLDLLFNYKNEIETFADGWNSALAGRDAAYEAGMNALNDIKETVSTLEQSVNTRMENTQSDARLTLILVLCFVVLSVVAAIIMASVTSRSITKPITMQMRFLKQVGETGSLDFTDDEWKATYKAMESKDETGQMLSAFVKMLKQFIYYGELLERVAKNDLTIDVAKLSETDNMGNSIEKMVYEFNHMFSEIKQIASQVASSSNEIAQGAQALAQGSTQQASTVEELSASITEIQSQAEGTNKLATDTVDEVNEAGRLMGESLDYMSQMTNAMSTIEDSSSEIAKVIGVIDNIAFQTNILALNAAVEAARAGQHGKGFAVVAEEVRNLATKSSEAAKETADLIARSVENVKTGTEIVEKTGGSLERVGVIAQNNAVTMNKMSEASDQQSSAITEVTTGITQISQVVQQNSATSEESAAASQEMSSQAQTLQGLVAQFKLKEDSAFMSNAPQLAAASSDMGSDDNYSDGGVIF